MIFEIYIFLSFVKLVFFTAEVNIEYIYSLVHSHLKFCLPLL